MNCCFDLLLHLFKFDCLLLTYLRHVQLFDLALVDRHFLFVLDGLLLLSLFLLKLVENYTLVSIGGSLLPWVLFFNIQIFDILKSFIWILIWILDRCFWNVGDCVDLLVQLFVLFFHSLFFFFPLLLDYNCLAFSLKLVNLVMLA